MTKPIPAPEKKDVDLGWCRGHDLVKHISDRTIEIGWGTEMEEVQAVIDVLIEMDYLDQATS